MAIEYKKILWSMMDKCRGSVDTHQGLEVITTIVACASLSAKRFKKTQNMGANALTPALVEIIEEQRIQYPLAFESSIEQLSQLSDVVLSQVVYGLAGVQDLTPMAATIRETLADNAGKRGGEFTSSAYMEALLPAVIGNVKEKSMLDAVCGLARTTSLINAKEIYLQEKNVSSASLALRLLLIECKDAILVTGDSLMKIEHAKQQFDLVVMEPPMGLRIDAQLRKDIQKHPYIIDSNKPIPTSACDALWIQLALHHLNESGKAYLILPQGSLFRGGYDSAIREHLLNNEWVDKVIGLPPGVLNGTGIPPVLLILDKGKEKGTPIRLVNLSEIGTRKAMSVKLSDDELALALDLIEGRVEDPKKSANVSVREIRQKEPDNTGNNLNIGRYVNTQEEIILPTVEAQNASLEKAKNSFEKAQEDLLTLLRQL